MALTRRIVFIVFLFFVGISSALRAQLNSSLLEQFVEKDGLPGLQVNTVLVDHYGFIWVATINGLARYDGYEFKRFYFNPNDTATFHGLVTYGMLEDRTGNIWACSSPSNLNRYDPKTQKFSQYPFKHLVNNPNNSEVNAWKMAEDDSGRIYFGVQTYYFTPIFDALLYKDPGDELLKKFQAPPGVQIGNINVVERDDYGRIWFSGYSGTYYFDRQRKLIQFTNIDSALTRDDDYVSGLIVDKRNHVWIISERDNLYDIDMATGKFQKASIPELKSKSENSVFKEIIFDKQGSLWIGSNNGIAKFDTAHHKVSKFSSGGKKELEELPIQSIAFDSFGALWAGTVYSGLIRYENKPQIKSYIYKEDDKNSITAAWVSDVLEISDGRILFSTGGSEILSGMNVLEPSSGKLQKFLYPYLFKNAGTRTSGVTTFWENSPGNIYIALYMINENRSAIFSWNGIDNKLKRVYLASQADTLIINHFVKDSRGNDWIAAYNGLYRKKSGTSTFSKIDFSSLPGIDRNSYEVSRIIIGKKKGVWFLTNNGLLHYDYDTDKLTRHGFATKNGEEFASQDINSMYEDDKGILWVGGWQGGLARYDVNSGKIRNYSMDDGLPSMSVQAIQGDEKNNTLWLATFAGLSRFDIQKEQFNNFGLADGIQGMLFADKSTLTTSKGLIGFGGSNGLTLFDPKEIKLTSIPPKVLITDIKLFGKSIIQFGDSLLKKPIYDTKELELSHDQNNLTIDFTAIHFSNPTQNRFAYKMENYDDAWREVGSQKEAFYPRLPTGKYIFHVKAANDKGVWNEEGATLSITIRPPWWRTTWAYILYAILFLLFIFAIDRFFRHRVVEKEREKSRNKELEQAREIQKAYEALKATQKQLIQAEKMASLGELTAGIAHEIQNPLNFVNNFAEVNEELSTELLEAVKNGNTEEAKELADQLLNNEKKIRHHGLRADSIVKSMLQHSRISSGHRESTDINALVDEYVRLAYHGTRAKDKSFNVDLVTEYDPNANHLDIMPQDIGRVIVNLVNNAFFATNEKKIKLGEAYSPQVKVSTKRTGTSLAIKVADNGEGISNELREKIFQPFFTTKPAGHGTGLGLSLSYDIIKSHNGEISVESSAGEGTVFTIMIPA
jgi:signal transduction histidine kinase/ligand-binding sensor domain-containing protein